MGGWGCGRCGADNVVGTRFCGYCGDPKADAGEAETADERRLITALFADISGFTSLADKLDADALHETISPVIGLLASVAERYEGTIAKYAGDALLVFFGAPVAQEDHAERALRVALEMHAELARARAHLAPEARALELHIGVNTGKVVAGMFGGDIRSDYSILGDAVNVAQRLEASAPSGETYVGATTCRLTAAAFELEALGELTLKGKDRPIPAWRLVGARAEPVGTALGRGRFVGREPELEAARAVVDGLCAGTGGVITVTGEPGIGKSRLTAEVRATAASSAAAARWLEGRCISYGAGLPYWPYVALLRSELGIRIEDPPEDSARLLAESPEVVAAGDAVAYFAQLLGLAVPGGKRLDDLEPEAFRRGLHDAFARWLGAIAAQGPVVVVVEDLHWADPSSIALTEELAGLGAAAPVVFCVTGRPEAALTAARVASAVPPERQAILELAPLDPTATAALLESLLEGPPPPARVELIAQRAAGNPFFAEELVRSLLEAGDLGHDGGWHLRPGWDPAALPATVEGVLSARMDLLPRAAANVLLIASVVGRQVRLDLLDALTEDLPDSASAVDQLVGAGFLDRVAADGDRAELLVFHHALVLDAAYDRIVRRDRRQLHRKVADLAEELYGTGDDVVDLMARHLYLAGAGVKAIEYLTRAAARARRLFANGEAIVHLERAVELGRSHRRAAGRLPAITLTLADLHALVGAYDRAYELFDEVRASSGHVEAWRGLASVLRRRGAFAEARMLLERGFVELDPDGDRAPLWLELGSTLAVTGLHDESTEAFEAGLAAADGAVTAVTGELLLQLALNKDEEGLAEASLTYALEAQWLFEKLGDLRGRTSALRVVGAANRALGRLPDAGKALRAGLELAQRTGSVEEVGGCLVNLGMVELERGDLDAAIDCDRRAIVEFERVGHGPGRAIAHGNLAEKLLARGDVDEAMRYAEEALRQARALGRTLTIADVLKTLATICRQQGRWAEAASLAEEAAELFAGMSAIPSAASCLELAAATFHERGEGERAAELIARARSLVPPAA